MKSFSYGRAHPGQKSSRFFCSRLFDLYSSRFFLENIWPKSRFESGFSLEKMLFIFRKFPVRQKSGFRKTPKKFTKFIKNYTKATNWIATSFLHFLRINVLKVLWVIVYDNRLFDINLIFNRKWRPCYAFLFDDRIWFQY